MFSGKMQLVEMCFISVEVYAPGECAIGYMSAEKKMNKNIVAIVRQS